MRKLNTSRLRSVLRGRAGLSILLGAVAIALIAVGLGALKQPTHGYLVAARNLAVGQPVEQADFKVVEADLGSNPAGYLDSSALEHLGASGSIYVNSAITKGSLVRSLDLVGTGFIHGSSVSVELSIKPAESIVAGSRVDLWASTVQAKSDSVILALAATVVSVATAGTTLGGSGKYIAEIVVDDSEVPGVLSAIAQSQQLALVATSGT